MCVHINSERGAATYLREYLKTGWGRNNAPVVLDSFQHNYGWLVGWQLVGTDRDMKLVSPQDLERAERLRVAQEAEAISEASVLAAKPKPIRKVRKAPGVHGKGMKVVREAVREAQATPAPVERERTGTRRSTARLHRHVTPTRT